mmetsp:Transcript_42362/g.105750  ORF Transcript_42362/g.105750 Transcript_42362/m.105750 type:complete len:85 (+) Transcript_42362:221-475(+)
MDASLGEYVSEIDWFGTRDEMNGWMTDANEWVGGSAQLRIDRIDTHRQTCTAVRTEVSWSIDKRVRVSIIHSTHLTQTHTKIQI